MRHVATPKPTTPIDMVSTTLTPITKQAYDHIIEQNQPGYELSPLAAESWEYQHRDRGLEYNRQPGLRPSKEWTPPKIKTAREYLRRDALTIRCHAQKLQRENRILTEMHTAEGTEAMEGFRDEINQIIEKYLNISKNYTAACNWGDVTLME